VSQGYLLDTNVPSELTKPIPDQNVVRWIGTHTYLHISVISLGELRRGFVLLPPGKRRAQLEEWFDWYILPLFASRILPVTKPIAERWGLLGAQCQQRGRAMSLSDGLIAATALEYNLTVVTRNESDFAHLGVPILNPWLY